METVNDIVKELAFDEIKTALIHTSFHRSDDERCLAIAREYAEAIIKTHERSKWKSVSEPPTTTEDVATDMGIAWFDYQNRTWQKDGEYLYPKIWCELPKYEGE